MLSKLINFILLSVCLLSFNIFSAELNKYVSQDDLKKFFTYELQADKPSQAAALKLIQENYESNMRLAGDGSFGQVYPLQPEILRHLFNNIKNQDILEIGAASGVNAILAGLAGAKSVVINDLSESELKQAKNTIGQLSEAQKSKFKLIQGDCLEKFSNPEFTAKFDIIIIRNVFHFFNGHKRDVFISLINKLLKPQGRLVLSVNNSKAILTANSIAKFPMQYLFSINTLCLNHPDRLSTDNLIIHRLIKGELCDADFDLQDHNTACPHIEIIGQFFEQNISFNENYNNLSDSQKDELKLRLKEIKKDIISYNKYAKENWVIYTVKNYIISYNSDLLKQTFSDTFDTNILVDIDYKGHVLENAAPSSSAIFFAGIFTKKPNLASSAAQSSSSEASAGSCCFCHKAPEKLYKCSKCKSIYYCSTDCQKQDWKNHKTICKSDAN